MGKETKLENKEQTHVKLRVLTEMLKPQGKISHWIERHIAEQGSFLPTPGRAGSTDYTDVTTAATPTGTAGKQKPPSW